MAENTRMIGEDFDRRRFLQAACGSVVAGAAGCLELDSGNPPTYTDWIPGGAGNLYFAYIDFDLTVEEEGNGGAFPLFYPSPLKNDAERSRVEIADESLENPDDPLVALPIQSGGVLIAGGVIGLAVPGLSYLVDPEEENSVSELLFVDGVALALGDIEVKRADERLKEGGSESQFAMPFEPTGELGEFTVYEATEEDTPDPAGVVALSSSAVMLAESRDEIETIVETANGDHEQAVENGAGFDWLADTVGEGDLVVGWYGSVTFDDLRFQSSEEETLHDVFKPEDDVLSTVTFTPEDDEISVDLAVRSDGLAGRTDRLESTVGESADDHTMSFESDRFTASGTYEDISFERVNPEGEDDGIQQGELPDKVAEAVPEDAFTFEYNEEEEAVRVEIVEDFEAEEVKVESVNYDYEVSIDRASSGTWLNAYVDPEGDTVRVIVTVDGTAGVVATREVP